MAETLTFNDVTFSPVSCQGNLWIHSAELARALGYADESSVGRIYRRNADEFASDMTQLVEISRTVNLTVSKRLFSLRGCHLVAMFARTPVAKAFRRWVLDVLDAVEAGGKPSAFRWHGPPQCSRSGRHELEAHFGALRTIARQIDGHIDEIFRHVRSARRDAPGGSAHPAADALPINAMYALDNAASAIGCILTTVERTARVAVLAAS